MVQYDSISLLCQYNICAQDPANPLLVEDQLWDVRWDNTYITSMYDNSTGRRDQNISMNTNYILDQLMQS